MQMNSVTEIITIEKSVKRDRDSEAETSIYSTSESCSDPAI
jgi:hypothetical protein